MSKGGLFYSASISAALAAFGVFGQAQAQVAQVEVSEVMVTAQRRTETVQQVPAAITALNEQMMAQRGITDVETLQFAAPSITFGRRLGAAQATIRGVGRSVGQPGVAINIDGVYQPRDTPMIVGQTDLDRAEILRGPQGTLYGRNSNGGAVNFITKAPTAEFGGYVQASYASYDEYRVQTAINLPVSDRVRTRLAFDYNVREKGFVKNVAGGPDLDTVDTLYGRVRVGVDLTDDLELDLNFNALRSSGADDYWVLTTPPSAQAIALSPFLANAIVPLDYWRTSADDLTRSDRAFESLAATLTWRLGGVDVKSISAYQRLDADWDMDRDGVNLSVIPTHIDEKAETFTQEFNISGTTGPVNWVAGLYYFKDKLAKHQFYAFKLGFPPAPPNSFLVQDLPKYDTEAYAAFGDATLSLTDRFRLIGGLRYSEDKQTVVHRNFVGSLRTGAVFVNLCPLQRDDLKSDSVTYRAGAQFDVTDQQHVYGTVSTGYKAGGSNTAGCNNTFKPEEITSYEGGFKGRFFDNRLTFNASAFWYDYSDFQLQQVVGIEGRITNAASATVKGLEVETQLTPDDHWSFNASVTVLRAKFGSFTNTDSLNPQLGPQDLEGRYLANSPKLSGNLGIAYRTAATDRGRLTGRVDVSARSRVYFREFNDPRESQPAYAIVGANLIWDSPDERYAVRLFVNNLFDEGYWVAMHAVEGLGARPGVFGSPRQVGVELRARF